MVRTRHLMLFVLAVLCSILYVRPLYAFDVGTVVFPTAAAPSDGCVLAAVDGKYVADAQAAVARINEIRYEACNEGIDDPRSPSRKLTAADYVPVRWSSALEYIARVRAAEASIAVGHTRPNGNSCFTVYAPDGSHSYGEVLAWNHSSGLIQGINQWYGEKADWVNKTGRVTGHYEILINPSLTYVGIGCFLSDTGVYPNSTAGEFSTDSGAGETPSAGIADCRVILDIRAAAVAAPASIFAYQEEKTNPANLHKGDRISCFLGIPCRIDGENSTVADAGNITWSSSDASVAKVDSFGNLSAVGIGSVTITAVSDSGRSASAALTVKENITISKTPASVQAKAKKSKVTVTWAKLKKTGSTKKTLGQIRSIEVQYATDPEFSQNEQTISVGKNKTKAILNLDRRTTFFIRVRYVGSDGFSKWSRVKKIRTK